MNSYPNKVILQSAFQSFYITSILTKGKKDAVKINKK
ncbi:hypothetical protein T11_1674 [Trichinella zimbabwensis]|uniref:Uncharacterized protein n=1 Tax=Trichinella zimbabwensis TaxID=268475 RepID=A0A0V1GCF6_9BILA|nr:hypothetical protein T11_1674 [Trichinella zimbabwensis]